MRDLRAKARAVAADRAQKTRLTVDVAVGRCRGVMSDRKFRAILVDLGVKDAPRLLLRAEASEDSERSFGDPSLYFAVAWSFFKPLFDEPIVVAYLNKKWPEFVMEMKDAFISLVLDGPFPACADVGRPRRAPFPSQRKKDMQSGPSN
ncbi:MAG: hypothetical protein OJI67_24540 [Prosthecobacter sp.]|nr:hypothetical protein [Prosthecobacter sp.]